MKRDIEKLIEKIIKIAERDKDDDKQLMVVKLKNAIECLRFVPPEIESITWEEVSIVLKNNIYSPVNKHENEIIDIWLGKQCYLFEHGLICEGNDFDLCVRCDAWSPS